MTAREYRIQASDACKPHSGQLALIWLIYEIIIAACAGLSVIGIGAIASLLISGPFTASLIIVAKENLSGVEPKVEKLFEGFKDFVNNFVLGLLVSLFTALWALLFVIPGLIKSYSYAMAFYIHLDNPELGANDCITKSREMMDGHKWQLFCLDLSYIGWLILCGLTLGILTFWVAPKIQTAHQLFYNNLAGATNTANEEAVIDDAQ